MTKSAQGKSKHLDSEFCTAGRYVGSSHIQAELWAGSRSSDSEFWILLDLGDVGSVSGHHRENHWEVTFRGNSINQSCSACPDLQYIKRWALHSLVVVGGGGVKIGVKSTGSRTTPTLRNTPEHSGTSARVCESARECAGCASPARPEHFF